MILAIAAFIVGVLVGAYSHKWLAAEAIKAGVPAAVVAKPTAASVAQAAASEAKKL